VCIGPRCVVEEEADLVETIIWGDTHIGARAWMRHTIIGERCRVGRDAQMLDAALPDEVVFPDGDRRLGGHRRLMEVRR
jgi:NDP-sugar pyrophosphorylase family protein